MISNNNYTQPNENKYACNNIIHNIKDRIQKNKINAVQLELKNIQKNDIILLNNMSNIFYFESKVMNLYTIYFIDFDFKKVYIKIETNQIEKIIFRNNYDIFSEISEYNLKNLKINDIAIIYSENKKIVLKIKEIFLNHENIHKSKCIGIITNRLDINSRYNLLNNILFKFENIFTII